MMADWCLGENLMTINQNTWTLLFEGVHSYKNPFHYGVLSTIDIMFPSVRTVIIREVDIDDRIIRFNTDVRSPKFKQLTSNPNVSWLFYDEKLRLQLRLRAVATLHTEDEVADNGWDAARLNCKITYMAPQGPGTELDAPYLLDLNRLDVRDEELLFARKNFAIVQTKVLSMDWAFLHHKGNRRALFDYEQKRQKWIQT